MSGHFRHDPSDIRHGAHEAYCLQTQCHVRDVTWDYQSCFCPNGTEYNSIRSTCANCAMCSMFKVYKRTAVPDTLPTKLSAGILARAWPNVNIEKSIYNPVHETWYVSILDGTDMEDRPGKTVQYSDASQHQKLFAFCSVCKIAKREINTRCE